MRSKNLIWIGAIIFSIIIGTAFSAAYANSFFNKSEGRTEYSILPPSDTIPEGSIKVYNNKVIIEIPAARWSSYLDTGSMEPTIMQGANGIEIIPKTKEDIHIGDIIAYETRFNNIPVVHRVVDIRKDELGTYFVLKGDSNLEADPVKVRFSQIRYKIVAIIY